MKRINQSKPSLFTKLPAVSILAGINLSLLTVNVFAETEDIRAAILEEHPAARIEGIDKINRDGETLYEVDYQLGKQSFESLYTSSGVLLSTIDESNDSDLIVGLYMRSESSIYKNGKSETQVYPYIYYDNGSLYVQGATLGYRFYRGGITLSSEIDIELGEGYEKDDNDFVSDMEELDTPIHAGLVMETELGPIDLSISAKTDISGSHKGYLAEIEASKEWSINRSWSVELGVNTSYYDKKYNNYFYGVSNQYARADRQAYTAKADINYGMELQLRGELSDRWFLISELEYTHYGKEVTNSSLVDKKSETSIAIGIGYVF